MFSNDRFILMPLQEKFLLWNGCTGYLHPCCSWKRQKKGCSSVGRHSGCNTVQVHSLAAARFFLVLALGVGAALGQWEPRLWEVASPPGCVGPGSP